MAKTIRASMLLFLAVQSIAYLWFLWLDLTQGGTGGNPIKYGCICVCLLFSVLWSTSSRQWLVAGGLLFTLGADTFLLLLDRSYPLGVALFCITQGLYLLRIGQRLRFRRMFPLRLTVLAAALAAVGAAGLLDGFTALVLLYFTTLLCNAIQSRTVAPQDRAFRLFSAGLALFVCCDLCVGVFNLASGLPGELARIGMWFFYLPSQVLITLSALPQSTSKTGDRLENQ